LKREHAEQELRRAEIALREREIDQKISLNEEKIREVRRNEEVRKNEEKEKSVELNIHTES